MRYVVNENNTVTAVSFGTEMEYNDCVCTEYTGVVPSGWDSLEDWYFDEGDKLWRWQIIGGSLTMDTSATEPPEGSWGTPDLQNKTVSPSTVEQSVKADAGYDGLGTVTVKKMNLQSKAVAPSEHYQYIEPDSGYDGLSQVRVSGIELQSKYVNPQSYEQTVYPDSGYAGLSSVTVGASSGGGNDVNLQSKTVTPKKDGFTVTPDSGYDGLSDVYVNGDQSLVGENIVKGKSIFGVAGTHECPGIVVLTTTQNKNNTSLSFTHGLGYSPEFIWIRSTTEHGMYDDPTTEDVIHDLIIAKNGSVYTKDMVVSTREGYYSSGSTTWLYQYRRITSDIDQILLPISYYGEERVDLYLNSNYSYVFHGDYTIFCK